MLAGAGGASLHVPTKAHPQASGRPRAAGPPLQKTLPSVGRKSWGANPVFYFRNCALSAAAFFITPTQLDGLSTLGVRPLRQRRAFFNRAHQCGLRFPTSAVFTA